MQNRNPSSIARKTLLHLAVPISLIIAGGVLVAFWHFYNSSQTQYLNQMDQYVQERTERERALFQLAETNLKLLQENFLHHYGVMPRNVFLQKFEQGFQQKSDGSWRNSEAFSDLNRYAGSFIDDDTVLTDTIRKTAVIFSDLANQYGPGWRNAFLNLYLIGRENFLTVYWPEVHWTQDVKTSIELTEQPYYFVQKPGNRERRPQWTDVYYDEVARKWLISVIAPLDLYGEQLGTVGQDLFVNQIVQRTLNDRLPGAFNFIFSRSGKVIVHPELMEDIFQSRGELKIPETENDLLLLAYEQALNLYDQDSLINRSSAAARLHNDSDFYLSVRHLPEPDWFFVAAYPKEEVRDQAMAEAGYVLEIGLISLLIELAIVYWVLRRQVSLPLQSFIQASDKVASGNYRLKLDNERNDELGQLAISFQAMQQTIKENMQQLTREIQDKEKAESNLREAHQALQDANDQLELRVLRRTASLNAANEELSHTLSELQQTQQQLIEAEKMSSLGGLVAGVAHEINTPIGICLTAASNAQDELNHLRKLFQKGEMTERHFTDFIEQVDESLRMLISNNQRASQLIQSFKQVSVDQSSDDLRTFLLKDYIEEVLFSLQPRLKKTRHQVELHCDEIIQMESYPGALSQVITNLVMNSLIHGFEHKERGLIRIEAYQKGDVACLFYRDDGCGMSLEAAQKVFDPFYTTKRGAGGSGLGAHLIYNLVLQKMGGTIQCASEPGKGVLFSIHLPVSV